jgi:hypothetical protein
LAGEKYSSISMSEERGVQEKPFFLMGGERGDGALKLIKCNLQQYKSFKIFWILKEKQ